MVSLQPRVCKGQHHRILRRDALLAQTRFGLQVALRSVFFERGVSHQAGLPGIASWPRVRRAHLRAALFRRSRGVLHRQRTAVDHDTVNVMEDVASTVSLRSVVNIRYPRWRKLRPFFSEICSPDGGHGFALVPPRHSFMVAVSRAPRSAVSVRAARSGRIPSERRQTGSWVSDTELWPIHGLPESGPTDLAQ